MKKIGLMCMALVLALGALGVGYAAWTDTITISGTVNTGDLDIDVEYVSGTTIYKDTAAAADPAPVVVFWLKRAGETDPVWSQGTIPASNVEVASAAAAVTAEDTVSITVDGAFPTEDLCADIIVHCVGSVPAKLDVDIDSTNGKLLWLYNNGFVTWKARHVTITDDGTNFSYSQGALIEPEDWPVQLENCDFLKIWLYLDLPQASDLVGEKWPDQSDITQEDFMNITNATFTAHVYAIQWNEHTPNWWP